MDSPLTCTAYHGRGKYYFNRTPNIHDENLNEYLNVNKERMHRILNVLNDNEIFNERDFSNLGDIFRWNKTTLIDKRYVEKIIKKLTLLLNKEEKVDSQLHPIEVMYDLMNEYYKEKELEKEIEERVTLDIESELADVTAVEGKEKYYFIKKYERNPRNRALAIKIHGLNCYVCNFNFGKVYGKLGEGFIEVHHIVPLSSLNEEIGVNPETDLVPLCANCHRMIHKSKDKVFSVDELKALVAKNRNT